MFCLVDWVGGLCVNTGSPVDHHPVNPSDEGGFCVSSW